MSAHTHTHTHRHTVTGGSAAQFEPLSDELLEYEWSMSGGGHNTLVTELVLVIMTPGE